jgi:preprotein translocase subunit SecB
MSESPNEAGAGGQQRSSFTVLAQYLKDLSFENPRAPASLQNGAAPKIDVNVDVQGRALGNHRYEVELSVTARATRDDQPAFVVEASYAGVFEIKNFSQEQLEMVMLVECPRLLFPFLRQIICDATRNGAFPPLMLEPIEFLSIYLSNKERTRQKTAGEQPPAS